MLLLSPGPLEEWTFCITAYVEAIKFLTGARMCLYLETFMGLKVLCLAFVCIYPAEGEASGADLLSPIHTNVGCMCLEEPGNETRFADWPEKENLDSS